MDESNPQGQTAKKQARLPGTRETLNVILHGLFTITSNDEEITLMIPNMGSDHLYKAGNWLAEVTLAQGDFRLVGVAPAAAVKQPFRIDYNIVLKNVLITDPTCCDRVYATLHVPYPESIRSLRRLSVPPDGIGGDSKNMIYGGSGGYSASVQVLTYAIESDSDLRLGQHPWEPSLDNGFVNLHIFSEPERIPEQDHIRHAFQMSMGLFTGVDLSLRKPMGPANLAVEKTEIPPGVHELELDGLVTRQNWLAVLGRAIKENRDLNGLWQDATAFDGDPNTCSGSGIGL